MWVEKRPVFSRLTTTIGRFAVVLAMTAVIAAGFALTPGGGLQAARAAGRASATARGSFRNDMGTGCSWDGSCGYCPIQGIGYGRCTARKLAFDVRWCGRQASRRTLAYRENKVTCRKAAQFLSELRGSSTCQIAALLAGRGVGKDAEFYLRLAELSDPIVDWTSWIAGIFGGAVADYYCHHG